MSKGKMKEGTILLIDVGQNVCEKDENGRTVLENGKRCAFKIVEKKIFSDSKDELGIVLMGSETTNNDCEYPNISVKEKWLSIPNMNILKYIDRLKSSTNTSDWLDGIIVAINLLKDESDVKKVTDLKIVMFSNFSTPIKSIEQVEDIIDSLKLLKINIVAICPHCENFDEDENSENLPNIKKKGLAIIGRIVDESGGLMCTFEEAMLQLEDAQKCSVRPQAWSCDLQIGNNIFIPISGYKKYSPKTFIKWGKKSVDNASVAQEFVFFQGDEQVEKQDIINSYLFGQTVVPISDDDKTSIKLTTEKSFQLLGFTAKENVPCHMYIGDSAHYIVPKNGEEEAKEAITALAKALIEVGQVGIVRKVYCKNSSPRLGAIIPVCENHSYFFYLLPLPFNEDERFVTLPKLKKVKPSQGQLDAVDKLIDDMDLSQYDEDEDPYSKLYNPSVENTKRCLVHKAINPELPLTGLSEHISHLLQPKPEILENASNALDNIKKSFTLEEIEQKIYRKGAADVFEKNDNVPTNTDEDIKDRNIFDSIKNFVQSSVTEVGTIDPEGNFIKLLAQGEPFKKVCAQMQTAIKKLLLTSNGVSIQKPYSALKTLRKHCIKDNPSLFNDFISALKDELVDANSVFWNLIIEDKQGLISNEESVNSKITIEEATAFYDIKNNETVAEENYEMEAEDMLDMI